MAIETYVKALQSGSYNAEELTHLDLFLESYNGRTLFEYMADGVNYINDFNDTFVRFGRLIAERQPSPETAALYALAFKEGLAILVNKLVYNNNESTLLDMINSPSKYFTFLSAQTHEELMPVLSNFIPEVELPKMIRQASLLHDISKITKSYSTLDEISQAALKSSLMNLAESPLYAAHRNVSASHQLARLGVQTIKSLSATWAPSSIADLVPSTETQSRLRLTAFASAIGQVNIDHLIYLTHQQKSEHVFLLQIIYQSGQEPVKKEIAALMDQIIANHAKDIPTLNIIVQTIMPAPLGLWDELPHQETIALLSHLSTTSIHTLMKAACQSLSDPEAQDYYKKQLAAIGKEEYFILTRDNQTPPEQWKAACLLACFVGLGDIRQVKSVVIKLSDVAYYADKTLKTLISSPKSILVPLDPRTGFVNHVAGIAYLHHYALSRPLYKLDVSKIPPAIVSSLISQLLDLGIRYIRLETTVHQPSSTLFTQAQELLVEKEITQATLHYFLFMPSQGETPFDLIIKPTGSIPGPLTLWSTAHKKICANYLVQALPSLLTSQDGEYHFNSKAAHPSRLDMTADKTDHRIPQLQKALSSADAPSFVWILFDNSTQELNRYCYDIHLYADHIEPGFFTRNGCGNVDLLKQHIPSTIDMHATTSRVALTSPSLSAASSSSTQSAKQAVYSTPKKPVENKY